MKRLEARKFDRKIDPIGGEEGRPAHVSTPNPEAGVKPSMKARKSRTDKQLRGSRGTFEEVDVKKIINFIMENYDRPEEFKNHPRGEEILGILNHLLAVSMGGWHEENGVYINESGRCASTKNWELRGGQLTHRERNAILDDKDWIHDVRKAILEA